MPARFRCGFGIAEKDGSMSVVDEQEVPLPSYPAHWSHRHLLDLERLTADEITLLLDTAEQLQAAFSARHEKQSLLRGRTIANVFFENSTRTRNSFSLAAKRLGAIRSSSLRAVRRWLR